MAQKIHSIKPPLIINAIIPNSIADRVIADLVGCRKRFRAARWTGDIAMKILEHICLRNLKLQHGPPPRSVVVGKATRVLRP